MANFCVPLVGDNPDGWGPTEEPAHLKNIPYAPFSKSEKLGRVADFTAQNYQKNYGRGAQHTQAPLVFNFLQNEEEDNFHLVDTRPVKPAGYRPSGGAARRQQQNQRPRREGERDWTKQQPRRQYVQPGQKHNWHYRRDPPKQTVVYSSSIEIRPEWRVAEQIDFTTLNRLKPQPAPTPADLYLCGKVEYCDKSYDACTPKTERPIYKTKRVFRNVTTSDDPIMRNLAAEDKGHVFVTDTILTAIMCATRSVYSWDVVITKVGDKLFFDKRDQASISYLTINETAPDQVPEDKENINGTHQLSREATVANQNFSQQILMKGRCCQFKHPNPFAAAVESAELASCAYKYRKWSMHEGQLDVIVRCEVDAVQESQGKALLVSAKALVEFSQRQGAQMDWRQRLESQRGAVFATELKNNGNKIAKWTAAAILANVDLIKLGYVSRVSAKDNQRHALLAVHVHKPQDFAQQIGLKMELGWATLMRVVALCMEREDGKYLLLKEPNQPSLKLYELPGDAL